jgi:hypothetical protein
MRERDELVLFFADEGARMARWRNVAVFVWLDRMTVPRLQGAHRLIDDLLRQGPPIGALTLVPQLRLVNLTIDDEARRIHTELYQKVRSRVVANAISVENTGFVAAFVRSVVSTTLVFTRGAVPTQVFRDRAEAVSWLAPFVGPEPDAARTELLARLQQLIDRGA